MHSANIMHKCVSALALCFVAACTLPTRQPPPELVDARTAYTRAEFGPAMQANASGLADAREALRMAEREEERDPGSAKARDLAYIASRKIQLAEASARVSILQAQEQGTTRVIGDLEKRNDAYAELEQDRARAKREKTAKAAFSDLSAFADVSEQNPRGTSIALSTDDMFAIGRTEILVGAFEKMNRIVTLIERLGDGKIVVVGHASEKSATLQGQALAERRAESVKNYLVGRGIAPERITSEKETLKAKDARGRSNRVEIILERPTTSPAPAP